MFHSDIVRVDLGIQNQLFTSLSELVTDLTECYALSAVKSDNCVV